MINIFINGNLVEIEQNTQLIQLLESLGYVDKTFAVAINEEFIAKNNYLSRLLQPEDRVDIVKPVQGG